MSAGHADIGKNARIKLRIKRRKNHGINIKLQNAMRHSLGCQMLDAGHDLDLVREQLGHTDIRTTKRYARRSDSTLTAAREGRRAKVIKMRREK